MNFFAKLDSYEEYLQKNPFHELLNIDLNEYGEVQKKLEHSTFRSVDPNLKEAFEPELDDLVRLHYLVTSRNVTTILEFGVGKSSIVFDHALNSNEQRCSAFVKNNLRRSNSFQCFSVDNNKEWIEVCKNTTKTTHINYHYSPCSVSTFNDRICTYFENLPNVCPDLIYLDGPDQFSPTAHVRGINTNHPDRLPMSADILAMEHFLLPGTLIVVDGRTANARFLKSNLQRNWSHYHEEVFDQHYFELVETPLGVYNREQIDFCLGSDFYQRIKQWN